MSREVDDANAAIKRLQVALAASQAECREWAAATRALYESVPPQVTPSAESIPFQSRDRSSNEENT